MEWLGLEGALKNMPVPSESNEIARSNPVLLFL